jgi:metal-responsive CopG/Arc/MetJ family transcriptional regulator
MKTKTSITLPDDVLAAIDQHGDIFKSRSAFLETAARDYLSKLARRKAEKRDLEIIDRHADALNAEAEDVLDYQAPI